MLFDLYLTHFRHSRLSLSEDDEIKMWGDKDREEGGREEIVHSERKGKKKKKKEEERKGERERT